MAITTLDGLIAAYKQKLLLFKNNSITTVAGQPFTLFDRAGYPPAGALNPSSTVNGTVPTDATTGFPNIQAFQGSNKGYLTRVEVNAPVGGSIELFDLLFYAGATTIPTAGTTTVTLASQPSYSSRLPLKGDGVSTNWDEAQLWMWFSTAGGNQAHSMAITYTDQDGNTGATTGNLSTQNLGVNRLQRFPLASGDTGVQKIESYAVNGVASATGAVVALVMRSLGVYRVNPGGLVYGPDQTGMPQVFAGSALLMACWMDSTSSSTPYVNIEISEG